MKEMIEQIFGEVIAGDTPVKFERLGNSYAQTRWKYEMEGDSVTVYPASEVVFDAEKIEAMLAVLPEKARKSYVRFLALHEKRHVYQTKEKHELLIEAMFESIFNFEGHGTRPAELDANTWACSQARNPLEKAVFALAKIEQELGGKLLISDKDQQRFSRAMGLVLLACAFTR